MMAWKYAYAQHVGTWCIEMSAKPFPRTSSVGSDWAIDHREPITNAIRAMPRKVANRVTEDA